MQQYAVGLDSSKRHERRDGDFEAEDVHELLDGLGENLVGAKGDPSQRISDYT